jgi:hypothetical protein
MSEWFLKKKRKKYTLNNNLVSWDSSSNADPETGLIVEAATPASGAQAKFSLYNI